MPERQQLAPGGHYSRQNPPPSEEVALLRIDELELAIKSCETQLEFENQNRFETYEDYLGWRASATSALTHYRTEVQFLYRWVGGGKLGGSNAERYRSAIAAITSTVRSMTDEMSRSYKRIYTEQNPPANLAAAQRRKQELVPINVAFQAKFTKLKGMQKDGDGGELSEFKMSRLKQPLTTLFNEMMGESKLLGDFIKSHLPPITQDANDKSKRVDWTLFLLSLVERGVAAGLVLTPEEIRLVEEIRNARLARLALIAAPAN